MSGQCDACDLCGGGYCAGECLACARGAELDRLRAEMERHDEAAATMLREKVEANQRLRASYDALRKAHSAAGKAGLEDATLLGEALADLDRYRDALRELVELAERVKRLSLAGRPCQPAIVLMDEAFNRARALLKEDDRG
jgi:hypothetical protein